MNPRWEICDVIACRPDHHRHVIWIWIDPEVSCLQMHQDLQ